MALDRRVALQLWMPANSASSDEVARVFEQARELGYEHVQLSGAWPSSAAELKKLAAAAGLGICASHENARDIVEAPERVADRLSTLGCRFAAYSGPHRPLATLDDVLSLADELSRAGEVLRSRGQLLTYHNHSAEFRKLGGKAILDWLYERTDPIMVHGELDTFWVQAGGGDPAGYCARLSGRLPLLLLKDYGISDDAEPVVTALGHGNLSFSTILREAYSAACEWYVVGQDRAQPPFAHAGAGLRYLASV